MENQMRLRIRKGLLTLQESDFETIETFLKCQRRQYTLKHIRLQSNSHSSIHSIQIEIVVTLPHKSIAQKFKSSFLPTSTTGQVILLTSLTSESETFQHATLSHPIRKIHHLVASLLHSLHQVAS